MSLLFILFCFLNQVRCEAAITASKYKVFVFQSNENISLWENQSQIIYIFVRENEKNIFEEVCNVWDYERN